MSRASQGRLSSRAESSDGPGPYMLLTYPAEDSLFASLASRAVATVRMDDVPIRTARRQLRMRFQQSDLHRQRDVLLRGQMVDLWIAYRDGRGRSPSSSDPWWSRRGAAHAVVRSSGRVSYPNAAFRSLLRLDGEDRSFLVSRDFLPAAISDELSDRSQWLEAVGEGTSATTIRRSDGSETQVEFHAARDADGPGRHGLTLRSLDQRDATIERRALESSILSSLSVRMQLDLVGRGHRRDLDAGQRLPSSVAGEPWIALVFSGIVRLYVNAEGMEPTLVYGRSGSVLGTHFQSGDEPMVLGLQAINSSVVMQLDLPKVIALAHAEVGFAQALLDEAGRLLRDIMRLYAVRSAANLEQRLAREILLLTDLQPDDTLLSVTEQQLAEGVGSIRESVGRTIAQFRRLSLIATTRYGLIVLDREGLRKLAPQAA